MASLRERIAQQRVGDKPISKEKPKELAPLEFIKEHPFKTLFQPISKTLGKPTVKELYREKLTPRLLGQERMLPFLPTSLQPAVWHETQGAILADIADIAQTPISYIPLPIGKLLGKIPIRGTTLGRVARQVPIGKGFGRGVAELGKYEQALRTLSQRVAASRAPLVAQDPIQKITTALRRAKPIRAEQQALYAVERARRAGRIVEVGQKVPGEAGFRAQLKQLKGELPKVQFEGIRGKVTQTDVDSLFNMVEFNQALSPYERITAKTGLGKLLGVEGGIVPTKGEIKLLQKVFSKDFIQTVLSKKPFLQKIGEGFAEVANVPRAIMASFDLSAPLRQGVFLIGKTKQFVSAFGHMFRYAFSEKAYQGLLQDIKRRPTYALMKESKLPLTELGAGLTGREEAFMSQLPEKIPLIGRVIRGSNRAYTGFLNKLRADVFDNLVGSARQLGLRVEGKVSRDIARFVGAATGRGALPGVLQKAAVTLNTVFFSPRLMASRLQLLNPVFYTKLHPFVRKEALKSLLTFGSTAASIMGLAKLGGAEVGADPRSADFGKIKIGNTRYDVLGGFQQYIRLAAQLISGEHISSTTGVKTTLGEGFKPVTRYDILGRFLETKEAPITSFATLLLKGSGRFGAELEIPKEVGQRFTPMVVQDMYDLAKERGITGIGMAVPAIFGVGIQTYAPTASDMVYSANSVLNNYNKLLKQGRTEEAINLRQQNERLINVGKALEPLQRQISSFKKIRKETEKNIRLSVPRKKQLLNTYDQRITILQEALEERYRALK